MSDRHGRAARLDSAEVPLAARPEPIRAPGTKEWGAVVKTQEKPAIGAVLRVVSRYGGESRRKIVREVVKKVPDGWLVRLVGERPKPWPPPLRRSRFHSGEH